MSAISVLDSKKLLASALKTDSEGWFSQGLEPTFEILLADFRANTLEGTCGEQLHFEWSVSDPRFVQTTGDRITIERQFYVETLPNGLPCPVPEVVWVLGVCLWFPSDGFVSLGNDHNYFSDQRDRIDQFERDVRSHPACKHYHRTLPERANLNFSVWSDFDPEILLRRGEIASSTKA